MRKRQNTEWRTKPIPFLEDRLNGNKLLKEFEDNHREDAQVKVRSENEQTQSARQANENPFLRKVLKMSSFSRTRDFHD